MSPRELTPRALNRALLDRQWLLRRTDRSVPEVVEHLVGLQAQQGDPPYYQLWSRIAGFQPDDLSRLLLNRELVRVALMRGTIHLVTARDCMGMRAAVQPYLSRTLFSGSQFGKRIAGVDPDELTAAAGRLLADGPLTNDELAQRLEQLWPDHEGTALAYGARGLLPLIQVPPRGVWGQGGPLTYASASQWLDVEPAEPDLPDLVLRYLAAFGPASVADFQKWSVLTRMAPVFDALRDRLTVYRDQNGRELFDVAGTALPDPDTPVPVTVVGPFDNLLLGHADKTRVISKDHEKRVAGVNAIIRGTYLVDGRVAGAWKVDRSRKTHVRLAIERFSPLSDDQTDELVHRAEELLDFAAEDAPKRSIAFD